MEVLVDIVEKEKQHSKELYDIIDDLRWKLTNAKYIITELKVEKEELINYLSNK